MPYGDHSPLVCKNPIRGELTGIGSLDFGRTSQWAGVSLNYAQEREGNRVPKTNLEDKEIL